MSTAPTRSLLYYLQQVPDFRGRKGQRHDLIAMLATVICAVLSNHGNYEAMVQWIHLQEPTFWHRLGYRRTPPKATTFRRLLSGISADALQAALWQWITDGLGLSVPEDELPSIIIDGKTLRGTKSRHTRAWQVLTLLDQKTGCVLSQAPVGATTNEVGTAQRFLEKLVLKGKLVVGDAAYCQREFCQTVLDGGGDYLVLVKDNQPQLHRALQQAFVIPKDFSPLPTAVGA